MMSAGCQSVAVVFFIERPLLTVINHAILEFCCEFDLNSRITLIRKGTHEESVSGQEDNPGIET
ncbi:hypothetical protein EGM70_09905 [Enterobacteriaceae bacterium 89]|nr:hypothetical protein [Enterobacteriaceae bacterium 89]